MSRGMNRVLTLLVLACMMTVYTAMVPAHSFAGAQTGAGDFGMEQFAQFNDVELFLKQGNSLSAEPMCQNRDDRDRLMTCPDGYIGTGLFGYGIITAIGQVVWMRVGRWESGPIAGEITVQNPIKYSIYVAGSYRTTGDFAFNMLVNGRPVNPTSEPSEWTQARNQRIETVPTRIEAIEEKINMSATPVPGGSTIGVEIWCRLQGDVKLHYGSFESPSSISIRTNPIVFRNMEATDERITFVYSDAFSVPISDMMVVVNIDGNVPQVDASPGYTGGFPAITWELSERLQPGIYSVNVILAYDRRTNRTFEFNTDIVIPEPEHRLEIPGWIWNILILIAIVIAAYFGYTWYEDRKLEKFMEEGGYDNLEEEF